MVHRNGADRPPLRRAGSRTRIGRKRYVRARCADGLAHASARPDVDRHLGGRKGAAMGRTDRGHQAWGCRLVSAGREALARRVADDRHDAYRYPREARRQSRRLAGARHGGAVQRLIARAGEERQEHFHGPSRQIRPGHARRVAEVEGPSVNDRDATTATSERINVGRSLDDAAATRAPAKRRVGSQR